VALVAARYLSGWRHLVRTRQREAGGGVIERRIRPHNRVMTLGTQRRREARRNVIRHGAAKSRRAIPGRLVAAVAIRVRRRERVIVADVAVRAEIHLACWRHLMRTHQRPAGSAVIENRRSPGDGVVARRAVRRRK